MRLSLRPPSVRRAAEPTPSVPEARSGRPTRLSRARASGIDILVVFGVLQLGCVLYALAAPDSFNYLSTANATVMLQAIPELAIPALGVGLLMVAGEFDLSIGANYTFSAIAMASLVSEHGWSAWPAAALAVLIGIAIGLLNAAVTFGLRIPSFITTLGIGLFFGGATLLLYGSGFVSFNPVGAFASVSSGSVGILQASFVWFLVLAALAGVLLHRHRLGNKLYAAGDNPTAAVAIGVRTKRVKTIAFALAGVAAAISGVLATSRVNSVVPGSGADLALQAIAACVIGGCALNGGRGNVLGISVGAALIYTIQDILLLSRAPGYYLDLFVGLLIISAAGLNQVARGRTAS